MMRRLRMRRGPSLLLAFYVTCLALVCSFILFEVLDIDGSDFPAPMRTVTPPHLAEASHDVKRAHLAGLGQPVFDLPAPAAEGLRLTLRVKRATSLDAAVGGWPVALAFRVTLARSSLDVPAHA